MIWGKSKENATSNGSTSDAIKAHELHAVDDNKNPVILDKDIETGANSKIFLFQDP